MRKNRALALVLPLVALVVASCATAAPPTATPVPASLVPNALATTFVLGGPTECPDRPFCGRGLRDRYGLTFKSFKALDAGGPATVEALTKGDIQVGLLFTSDPAIAVNDFVLLADDKGLQRADNLVPVVRKQVADSSPAVRTILDAVSAKLSQDALIGLNRAAGVERRAPADVAKTWLDAQSLSFSGGSGTVRVGSANFSEQVLLGEVYAQALERAGFTVERHFQLGNREKVYPALKAGQVDLVPEYAATLLEFVDNGTGEATTDARTTVDRLNRHLSSDGLIALAAAEATNQNGFAVTKGTAARYALAKISDLAQPAP